MTDRVAAMAALERAAWRVIIAWHQIGADARNDRPWRDLRGGAYLDDGLIALSTVLDTKPLTGDDLDALLLEDA